MVVKPGLGTGAKLAERIAIATRLPLSNLEP